MAADSLFRIRKPKNENPEAQRLRGELVLVQKEEQGETLWPKYPSCAERLLGCEGWICCLSVFRALGNKSAQVYLRQRVSKIAASKGLEEKYMTHEWDQKTSEWYKLPDPKKSDDYNEWAVKTGQLSQFIGWALERSRKTREEKLRLFALFGFNLEGSAAEAVKGPIENELLSVLSQCLPFKIEYQYRVGKYRLDAFIPRLRLAVQIDEHGHRGYDPAEEKEYDETIRDNNIVCLRFNPDQKYGGVEAKYEMIRQIWERTLSPDFSAFREKHKLEALVEQLIADMQKGNYVSAAANGRNILAISQRSQLRPEVIAVAQRAVKILEQKGYSEQKFMQEMVQVAMENPPPNTIPVGTDGTCPAGYFPLFTDMTDPKTRRYCAKMQAELQQMDKDINATYKDLTKTEDKIAFENRFMMRKEEDKASFDEMVGIGITPNISKFMERHKQSEVERLTKKADEIEQRKTNVKEVFGETMTDSLYATMVAKFGSAKKFVVWFVNHDKTYWWIGIYIFRFVALFGCMYISVANVYNGFWDYLKAGLKASWEYVFGAFLPNIMAAFIGSSLLTMATQGMLHFMGWIGSVLGIASLTQRLISLFSEVGFVMDLYFLLRDVITAGWSSVVAMASEVAGGNFNPLAVIAAGLHKGTATYCDTVLKTFLALAINAVGDVTKRMFIELCKLVSSMFSGIAGHLPFAEQATNFMSRQFCVYFAELMDYVMIKAGRAGITGQESISEYIDKMASARGATSMSLLGQSFSQTPAGSGAIYRDLATT